MTRMLRRRSETKTARSASAYATDRVGKMASENETPIRLTGTTW